MSVLPEPLTPPDCDLRGLEYMPLLGHHLFGSEFHAKASDSEWRAAVTLWWAAWTQKPAASLPDDDVALCRLADLGRDLRGWKKLRKMALYGFEKCSDGRLYHKTLAEQAIIAFEKRIAERERKAAWRAKRATKDQALSANVPEDVTGTETGTSASRPSPGRRDVPADGTGRDVKKEERTPKPPEPVNLPADVRSVMEEGGFVTPPPDLGMLREWYGAGATLDQDILPMVRKVAASLSKPPFKLKVFDAAIREKLAADAREIDRLKSVARRYSEPPAAPH